MSSARLTTARLQRLAAELPDRYTVPVLHRRNELAPHTVKSS